AAAAGFQWMAAFGGVRSGQHESLGIERDAGAGEPIRVRLRADEEEQVPNWPPHLLRRSVLLPPSDLTPADSLHHPVVPFPARDPRLRRRLQVRESGDAVDEVARHARSEARSANQ